MIFQGDFSSCAGRLYAHRRAWPGPPTAREVGLIDLLAFSVGVAHGRERLRAMREAQDRGHGPLLQFNQLNLPLRRGLPPTH